MTELLPNINRAMTLFNRLTGTNPTVLILSQDDFDGLGRCQCSQYNGIEFVNAMGMKILIREPGVTGTSYIWCL